jgi:hypothetical protein
MTTPVGFSGRHLIKLINERAPFHCPVVVRALALGLIHPNQQTKFKLIGSPEKCHNRTLD